MVKQVQQAFDKLIIASSSPFIEIIRFSGSHEVNLSNRACICITLYHVTGHIVTFSHFRDLIQFQQIIKKCYIRAPAYTEQFCPIYLFLNLVTSFLSAEYFFREQGRHHDSMETALLVTVTVLLRVVSSPISFFLQPFLGQIIAFRNLFQNFI